MNLKVERQRWRQLSRQARRVLVAAGVGVAGLTLGTVAALSVGAVEAQALPLCGGNQTDHPAPYSCTNSRLIDGTTFTVVLDVSASGLATITYTLDAPRPADTPIRVRWHVGISSGPLAAEVSSVIPTGSTGPVTLSLTNNECGGQIDMKAVFTANGDSRGRIGAPLVSIPNCGATTTTTATTVPTTTTTATTIPTTTTAPTLPQTSTAIPVVTTTPSSVSQATVTTHAPLPTTGGSKTDPTIAGAVAAGLGAVLIIATRRRRLSRD